MLVIHLAAVAVPLLLVPAIGRVDEAAVPRAVARASMATGPLVAASFFLDRGLPAALLAVPWSVVTVAGLARLGLGRIGRIGRLARPAPCRSAPAAFAVAAYLVVSSTALVASRAGFTFRHLVEPIVELTAVHYGFAGAGAATLAAAALAHARPARRRLAEVALLLVVASAPVVALGFFTRHPLFQVGGAVTLTIGVVGVCYVTARDGVARAHRARRTATTALLAVAAAAPLVPMALAVAWAAAQHWDVPALDVPAMARTHGLANAVGFVGCGLLGYRRLREETPAC